MSEPTRQAQIDAANAYEALFVPALFGQWALKVADLAQIQPGQRVLDVACGTGILAREIASRIGTVIDPSPAVVSQFGLMFFTDRRQALREMLRVLAPGGRLAVAVWDSLDNMPAYAAEVALLERRAGRQAGDALRAPFVLGNRKELATLVSEAAVASAEITTHHGTAQFPSIRTMVEADLRGWLPVMGVILTEDQIGRILQEAEQALGAYATADGRAAFHLSAHLVSARKP